MEQPAGIVGDGDAAGGSEPLSADFEYTLNWPPILDENGVRSPMIEGPYPEADRQAPIWLAPAPAAG
jgi:hypothetical protein